MLFRSFCCLACLSSGSGSIVPCPSDLSRDLVRVLVRVLLSRVLVRVCNKRRACKLETKRNRSSNFVTLEVDSVVQWRIAQAEQDAAEQKVADRAAAAAQSMTTPKKRERRDMNRSTEKQKRAKLLVAKPTQRLAALNKVACNNNNKKH